MSIQVPMVATETVDVGTVDTYLVKIVVGVPGQPYNVFNYDTEVYDIVTDLPDYKGQLLIYRDETSNDPIVSLYVAVDISGTGSPLTWVRCVSSPNYFNPNTGQAFDPLAPLYSPLAS
jgi:hypothetical protein